MFRTLLGIGMGAEWPAGAALAMEHWPIRSRGFMSGILQGSWSIGFLLSSVIYGLLFDYIGWRGMLWIGVLPALSVVWIRYYVKEPEIWVENRRQQREQQREVRAPLIEIFKPGMLSQHSAGVLVDGEQFHPVLLDLGPVRDAPAVRPAPDHDGHGGAIHHRELS